MSNKPKIHKYTYLKKLVARFRDELTECDYILLYAFNGTGKTRLSMEFKDYSKKRKRKPEAETLYFNAFTEDLFNWDNDIENDSERFLEFNTKSNFFKGFQQLSMDARISNHLKRYVDFSFDIDYEKSTVTFKREVLRKERNEQGELLDKLETEFNFKISRGEENIFIWCVFLAICELAIEKADAYKWVKYIYIDDPISSLDENNVITVASDLAQILKKRQGESKIKTIISSHHTLFFNVMCNELKAVDSKRYFLHKNKTNGYVLQKTDDTPFFHHVALLCELKEVADSNNIKTFHFNILRTILEKTSSFFGYNDFSDCIKDIIDAERFARALNIYSHGAYSVYEPREMVADNKELFKEIVDKFLLKYKFHLPELFKEPIQAATA
jgi:energy-coupling factor transporter ATP-binding protein EcfA2